MSDASISPVTAYLIAPPEDAPQVAGWHAALGAVGVTCNDTWASAVVSDASTVDAAAVWDWTQDAATLSADWTAQVNLIQSAHLVAIVTTNGTLSTVQAQVAQYAIDAGIPLVYCGPTHDFLAVEPLVEVAASLAGCKSWAQTMVASAQIQAAMTAPNANLYSIRTGIAQYIQPPTLLDAGAAPQLGARIHPRATAPAAEAPSSAGWVAGLLLVGAAVLAANRWARKRL